VKHLAGIETQRLLAECASLPQQGVQQLVSVSGDGAVGSLSMEDRKKLLQDMFRALSAADALPEYEMISMPRMRVAVSQALCEWLLSVYHAVFESLDAAISDAHDVKSPSQVAKLLGVPDVI
jgi:hypothetical protein